MKTLITARFTHPDSTSTLRTLELRDAISFDAAKLIGLGLFAGLPHDPSRVTVDVERRDSIVARLVFEMEGAEIEAVRLSTDVVLPYPDGYHLTPPDDEGLQARGNTCDEALDRLRARLRSQLHTFGEPGDPLYAAVSALTDGARRAGVESGDDDDRVGVEVYVRDLRPGDVLDLVSPASVVSVLPDDLRPAFVVVTDSDGHEWAHHGLALHRVLVDRDELVGQRVQICSRYGEGWDPVELFAEGDVVDVADDEREGVTVSIEGRDVVVDAGFCRLVRFASAATVPDGRASNPDDPASDESLRSGAAEGPIIQILWSACDLFDANRNAPPDVCEVVPRAELLPGDVVVVFASPYSVPPVLLDAPRVLEPFGPCLASVIEVYWEGNEPFARVKGAGGLVYSARVGSHAVRLVHTVTAPNAIEHVLRAASLLGRRVRVDHRGDFIAKGPPYLALAEGVPEVRDFVEPERPTLVRFHAPDEGTSTWFRLRGEPETWCDVVTAVHLLDVGGKGLVLT